MSNSTKGFTLIELLIVISIIGLLASVVLVSFPGAMKNVRDGRRKHDLNTIRAALEQYWDIYWRYPKERYGTDASIGCDGSFPKASYWCKDSDLQNLVAEKYFGKIPIDPINNTSYYYRYEPSSAGQGGCKINSCEWSLCARLETTGAWHCVYSIRNSDTHPAGGP